jgi:hypothetical protein
MVLVFVERTQEYLRQSIHGHKRLIFVEIKDSRIPLE